METEVTIGKPNEKLLEELRKEFRVVPAPVDDEDGRRHEPP